MSIPYNFKRLSPLDYEFFTENKVPYLVSFADASGYFQNHPGFAHLVKSFVFQIQGRQSPPSAHDPRVGATIVYIIGQFFEQNPEGILFFIHDSSDGKEHGRKRMFDSWYLKASSDVILKQDAEIGIGRFTILTSILLRHDHPQLDAVLSGYEELVMGSGDKPE